VGAGTKIDLRTVTWPKIDLRTVTPTALAMHVDPGYRVFPHIQVLEDVFLRLWSGEIKRLIVQMPPQHGKSQFISGCALQWALGQDPSLRVALVSYSHRVAKKWGHRARNFFAEYGPELFGLQVSPTKRAGDNWEFLNHRGGMIAVGVTGSLAGEPVDLGIIDDPVKDARCARSLAYREAQWDWYSTVFLTRLSRTGKAVILTTRWHLDDLCGRLLQLEADGHGDGWHVLNLPAIAPASQDVPEEYHSLFFPDPLGRQAGEALCPSLHPLDKLLTQKRAQGEEWFWALCQGLPLAGSGNFVTEEHFRPWEWGELPVALGRDGAYYYPDLNWRFDEVIQSWDTAYAKNSGAAAGAYVCGQVWARKGAHKYLLDEVRERWGLEDTIQAVRELSRKWPMAGLKLFEAKATGPEVVRRLQSEIPGMLAIPVAGSKEDRARAQQHNWLSGNVHIPASHLFGWVRAHRQELCAFPNGIYKDRVDAAVQAMAWLNDFGSGGALREDRATP